VLLKEAICVTCEGSGIVVVFPFTELGVWCRNEGVVVFGRVISKKQREGEVVVVVG